MRRAVAVLAGALCCAPALAQSVPAARFAARPPAPFTVADSSHPGNDRAFVINSSTGKPAASNSDRTLCKAAFKAAEANARLKQQQINTLIASKPWRENVRATLGALFALQPETVFTQAGVSGLEFVGTPRAGPGAAKARVYIAMAETPAGRTTLSCATFDTELASALPAFRTIRNSLTMP